MGKALVIEGLQVSNPLCVVTIGENTPERELSAYFAKNKGISTIEKNALISMVGTLMDNNLWSKIKVMLPICGASASDMLIDAVNPEETIIADASRYSVDDNKLKFASAYSSTDVCTFSKEISMNLSSYFGCKHRYPTGNCSALILKTDSEQKITFDVIKGGYRQPSLSVGDASIQAYISLSVENRLMCTRVGASSASLYCNSQLLAEGACSPNGSKVEKCFNFSVAPSSVMWATFMCIANNLTSDEETIMYNAIDTFLTTIGKRA